jgi:hypothetical protein
MNLQAAEEGSQIRIEADFRNSPVILGTPHDSAMQSPTGFLTR